MVSCLGLAALAAVAPALAPSRDFAERLERLPGLQNVGRVAPGLYRGSAPTDKGLVALKALGIKTVVNLRHYHGSSEEAGCRRAGLDYIRLIVHSSDTPRDADVRRFLEVATDPARQPVYVHCWRGKDRTGVMCAAYRMAVEGWTREEALAEMDAFGFYRGWRDLRAYAESLPARLAELWPVPPPSKAGAAPAAN